MVALATISNIDALSSIVGRKAKRRDTDGDGRRREMEEEGDEEKKDGGRTHGAK